MTQYLDVEDLVALARRLGLNEVREIGLLASAAARPMATAFGEEAYADVATKAAALLHSIVTNHPLVDGNKRLGWLATATFLELNDASVLHVGNNAIVDLVVKIADGRREVPAIARLLARWIDQARGREP